MENLFGVCLIWLFVICLFVIQDILHAQNPFLCNFHGITINVNLKKYVYRLNVQVLMFELISHTPDLATK